MSYVRSFLLINRVLDDCQITALVLRAPRLALFCYILLEIKQPARFASIECVFVFVYDIHAYSVPQQNQRQPFVTALEHVWKPLRNS